MCQLQECQDNRGTCKKDHVMDAGGIRKECKDWQRQDCTNCQFLSKDAATYYYDTTHRLWWTDRGNPYTGDRCEGCALRAYASIRKTIDQVKRDTSDLYETVGCLSVEHVIGRFDIVSTLELIAESISTSTSKAGEMSLQVREIQRTCESVQQPHAADRDDQGYRHGHSRPPGLGRFAQETGGS